MNQGGLHANLYQGLVDAMQNDAEGSVDLQNTGPCVILLSKFICSANNIFELF